MSETEDRIRNEHFSVDTLLGIVIKGQTYKNLLYLVLAFPLGLAYTMFLSLGFFFGVFFFVLGIGIVILIATIAGVRLFTRFERWLANVLLRLDLQAPDDRPTADNMWSTIRGYLDAPSTWRGLGFVMLKLWLGIVGFLLFFFLWNALELITAPLRYPLMIEFGTVNGEPLGWTISTLPEAAIAVPLGIVLGIIVLHLSNGFAYVSERIAVALVGETKRSTESATEPRPNSRSE